MSENPAYSRAVSLHLSRTLDEIGINKLTVKHRRHTWLYREKFGTIHYHLIGVEASDFHFGSQTEGATTPGLHSDLDALTCHYDWNVIEEWPEWKQGKINLLMLQENTAPGYCHLQVLRTDIPMAIPDLSPYEHIAYDDRGRVLLKNTQYHETEPRLRLARHGPAGTRSNRPGCLDTDLVEALHCSSWPSQAKEFTRRHRRHNWPSQHLLQQATAHGVFLVPVGHKLSATEPLEWRISASSAERCLMFSLTIVQIKCYVVLKMLVKTFVEPRIKECISSYHCKTALLYCTEISELGFWRDDNLVQCVQRCLAMLLSWVTDGFCPHFIMPQENLFAGKVTAQNRDILRSIFTGLVRSYGRSLLHVTIDGLGHKLHRKLSTEPSTVPILGSKATVWMIGNHELLIHSRIISNIKSMLIEEKNTNPVTTARSVHQYIQLLRDRIRQADKLEQQAIQTFIETLSCWLGSLLASFALSRKVRVPKTAIRLIRSKAKYDIASTLKLASVFYCSGELRKVDTILQNMDDHFRRNIIEPVCNCFEKESIMSTEFSHMIYMYALKDKRKRAKLFATCVMFSAQDIHCVPPAIRYELFKDGGDVNCRDPINDEWLDLAVVDCQPYMYYLQSITYKQLGKPDQQKRSLSKLVQYLGEYHEFSHLETSWNLLGQCFEEMGLELEAAMICYRTSLQIRPRNNAAIWHVAILCFKVIQNSL